MCEIYKANERNEEEIKRKKEREREKNGTFSAMADGVCVFFSYLLTLLNE